MSAHHVVCDDCGHHAIASRAPGPHGCWRCGDCGGVGVEASDRPCDACGTPIPAKRLEIIPETHHCVHCAARLGGKGVTAIEPLGSRDDFRRDRASWRR